LTEVNGRLIKGPPKSRRSQRVIALPAQAVDALTAALARPHGEYVFGTGAGCPIRRHNFTKRVWQPATAAADLAGLRFHDLVSVSGQFSCPPAGRFGVRLRAESRVRCHPFTGLPRPVRLLRGRDYCRAPTFGGLVVCEPPTSGISRPWMSLTSGNHGGNGNGSCQAG